MNSKTVILIVITCFGTTYFIYQNQQIKKENSQYVKEVLQEYQKYLELPFSQKGDLKIPNVKSSSKVFIVTIVILTMVIIVLIVVLIKKMRNKEVGANVDELKNLQIKINELENTITGLKTNSTVANKEVTGLKNTNESYKQSNENLQSVNAELINNLSKANEQIKQLELKLERAEFALKIADEKITSVYEKRNKLAQELSELKKRLEETKNN